MNTVLNREPDVPIVRVPDGTTSELNVIFVTAAVSDPVVTVPVTLAFVANISLKRSKVEPISRVPDVVGANRPAILIVPLTVSELKLGVAVEFRA